MAYHIKLISKITLVQIKFLKNLYFGQQNYPLWLLPLYGPGISLFKGIFSYE